MDFVSWCSYVDVHGNDMNHLIHLSKQLDPSESIHVIFFANTHWLSIYIFSCCWRQLLDGKDPSSKLICFDLLQGYKLFSSLIKATQVLHFLSFNHFLCHCLPVQNNWCINSTVAIWPDMPKDHRYVPILFLYNNGSNCMQCKHVRIYNWKSVVYNMYPWVMGLYGQTLISAMWNSLYRWDRLKLVRNK